MTGFGLANPKLFGEREQARQRRCQRGGYHANVSLPLTTKRLIIRPFTPADFEAIHAVWSDPAVMAPIPSQAYDREQSWARLCKTFSHQARHGFSKWAVAEKATGTVIGECGVHYLEDGPDVELGYKLARAYWGQGLAPEAAQACLDWALAERPERVVAIVDPANIRSARILGKIGMVRDGTFSGSGHTWDFYVAISCQVTGTELQPHGRLPGTQFARLVAVDQVGYLAHRLSSRFPRLEGSASLEVI